MFQILLKGANGDELKKVKHVVQYGVFAAYHLALETSFLADEGATLPELPLKSPITVALPDKPSIIDRSISIIPGFTIPSSGRSMSSQPINELQKSITLDRSPSPNIECPCKPIGASPSWLSKGPQTRSTVNESASDSVEAIASFNSLSALREDISSFNNVLSLNHAFSEVDEVDPKESVQAKAASSREVIMDERFISHGQRLSEAPEQDGGNNHADGNMLVANQLGGPELASSKRETGNNEEVGSSKEEFPPSPSDHQSILVSLSTRCVWKGTVCERSHLFRIKYYGNFDKPLGRFLRDHLFDQVFVMFLFLVDNLSSLFFMTTT